MTQVWRVASGEPVGQQTTQPRAELLAVNDDGTVILEASGAATWLDLRTGASRALFNTNRARIAPRQSDMLAADGDGQVWTIDRVRRATTLQRAEFLRGKSLVAVSWDGRNAYVSDSSGDYFFDLQNGSVQQFLRGTRTGASVFARDGRFAIAADVNGASEIQIWNPIGPVRLASYYGDWKRVLAIWFSDENRELWALDDRGKLHRWTLTGGYAADLAAACLALRDSGARMELTDGELAGVPLLEPADKAPCLRVGPLSTDYYGAIARRALDAIAGRSVAFVPSDCMKRQDLEEIASCKKVFEGRWKVLEKLAAGARGNR